MSEVPQPIPSTTEESNGAADSTPEEHSRMVRRARIERLRSEYGDRLYLLSERFDVICRRPKRAEWERCMSMKLDDKQAFKALSTLSRGCVVWCEGATSTERPAVLMAWDALLDDFPGVADTVGAQLTLVASGDMEIESKKL